MLVSDIVHSNWLPQDFQSAWYNSISSWYLDWISVKFGEFLLNMLVIYALVLLKNSLPWDPLRCEKDLLIRQSGLDSICYASLDRYDTNINRYQRYLILFCIEDFSKIFLICGPPNTKRWIWSSLVDLVLPKLEIYVIITSVCSDISFKRIRKEKKKALSKIIYWAVTSCQDRKKKM